jgi:hypothetical protein
MLGRRRPGPLALVVSTLVIAGCPKDSTPSVTPTTPATSDASPTRTGFDVEVLVQASGRGPSENEAYAAARRALAEAVLGDAAWADVLDIEVHRRDVDPQRVTMVGGEVEVALGLPRERAALAVAALEEVEPEPQGPVVWHERRLAYLRAHAAAQACLQRRALFGAACEPGPTQEVDAAVAQLGEGLVLVAAQRDGVPVDARGRALRPPTVFALWRGVPLAGLPLRVETDEPAALALDQVMSNGHGQAEVPLVRDVALPPLRLVVDGEALLGPRRAAAPRAELRLEPRTVGLGRWGLVVVRGANASTDEAAAVIRTRLRGSALGEPQAIAPRDEATLRDAPEDRRARRITGLADAMGGQLDLLLVLSYDTRFASRMGGGRLWYEAEGTLEAHDAWTGRVVAKAQTRVEANDVGDDRAAAAARRKLAESLAAELLTALRQAGPR